MPKEKLIVNNYKVPGGWGGLAVRRACEIILERPGIKQVDLFDEVMKYTSLNPSSSGWIVTPSQRSPAERLWFRKKVGRNFCCYPNEFTQFSTGAEEYRKKLWLTEALSFARALHSSIKPGDLVFRKNNNGEPDSLVLFSGWIFNTDASHITKKVFPSITEMVDSVKSPWPAAAPACSDSSGIHPTWPHNLFPVS